MKDKERIADLETRLDLFESRIRLLESRMLILHPWRGWVWYGHDQGAPIETVVTAILKHLDLGVRHIHDSYTLEAVPDAKKRK